MKNLIQSKPWFSGKFWEVCRLNKQDNKIEKQGLKVGKHEQNKDLH